MRPIVLDQGASVGCYVPSTMRIQRHAWPLLIALAPPASADVPAAPAGVGTAGPASVVAAARDGSWVAMCQARHDTDHDGRLEVSHGFNATYGDEQGAYV